VTHYDLVIVGTGSGNSIVNHRFGDWRVAIVEEGLFGGTCTNVGCIPTKMFVYPADLSNAPDEGRRLGVDLTFERARWPEIRDRIFGRIDSMEASGRDYRKHRNPNVTVYEEHVRFSAPYELETSSGHRISADQIVLATGSRPRLPDVPGVSWEAVDQPNSPVHTSDTVMRIDDLPGQIVIVGGGYIAAEFAHVFSSFGSTVVQVARSQPLLRTLDSDIADRFTEQAAKRWDLRLECGLVAVEPSSEGVVVGIRSGDSGDIDSVSANIVLLATGREPNTRALGADVAGLDQHDDGRLVVDEYQRVLSGGKPVRGMWSLGDASSDYQLKHVANHEARIVKHNLLHPDDLKKADHRFVPAAIFTRPQIASVGKTEVQARDEGLDVVTVTQEYGGVAYGWAMEDEVGFVKLVADRSTGELLGGHIIGHEASMLIQPLIQAMSFGLSPHAVARDQYWIHPALPEVVENALRKLPAPPA
jgi:mycothione reductase